MRTRGKLNPCETSIKLLNWTLILKYIYLFVHFFFNILAWKSFLLPLIQYVHLASEYRLIPFSQIFFFLTEKELILYTLGSCIRTGFNHFTSWMGVGFVLCWDMLPLVFMNVFVKVEGRVCVTSFQDWSLEEFQSLCHLYEHWYKIRFSVLLPLM